MFMVLMASLCSGMIEYSTHHPKVEVSCSAIGNGRQILIVLLARGHSIMIEHSIYLPKVESLCPPWEW